MPESSPTACEIKGAIDALRREVALLRQERVYRPSRLVPLAEAARRLSLSARQVRVLIASGVLGPIVRPSPRRVAIEESVLEAFVASHREGGA